MSLAFFSVWPERFDFRVLDIAAQNIAQSDDVRPRELIQPITLSITRVDALGMCPARAVFVEGRKQETEPTPDFKALCLNIPNRQRTILCLAPDALIVQGQFRRRELYRLADYPGTTVREPSPSVVSIHWRI
jgi:hypothetical protein